jgi:osmotically-inducible protein OsmY
MSALKGAPIFAASGIWLLVMSGCTSGSNTQQEARKSGTGSYAADNTGQNANDENQATSFDQGTSEADREITQKVRQGLMDDSSLSTTARNVRVITREGKITLRGPVNSTQERSRIEAIAEGIAGMGNVRNELELNTQS